MIATLEQPEILVLDPVREADRIDALRSLNLLDTPAEDRFDRITQLAARFFGVPIAYVALIDSDRQWFKSQHGICTTETDRYTSFCQYTIHRGEPFIIPDTQLHPLVQNHALVQGEPFLRFYAGIPLTGPRGQKIGTFCIVDLQPRPFTPDQVALLTTFASLVEREINLGHIIQSQHDLLDTRHQLVEAQEKLHREFTDAARYVRLMLPPPLAGEENIDWQFQPSTHLGGDGLGYRRINDDQIAMYVLDVTGHGLGSALLAVTALELLRNPAAQLDFAQPHVVIERLNRTFQMKDHDGKFFSVWYGVYSRSKRTLTYANAGHPPALVAREEGGSMRMTSTPPGGSVLGIFPEITIPETVLDFPAGSELYLFTDGLYELIDSQGGHGSYQEFLDHLEAENRLEKPLWATLLHWLNHAQDKGILDDDVTLMRFSTRA